MGDRVRIAHVITKLELGGAQQIALETVARLDRARFHPILIAGEPGLCDAEAKSLPGLEFHQVPSLTRPIRPLADVRALIGLIRLFRRLRPTIVHTHSSKAGILGRWAARLAGVPIIVHSIHGFGLTPDQPGLLRRALCLLERSIAPATDRFFPVSRATRRTGIALGLFTEANSTVLPPGIDPERFRANHVNAAAVRRTLELEADRPLVGMIAPLKPQKAPVDFVRVAARVRARRPDAQFLLVGDGELRGAVEQEVAARNLEGCFRLAGWRRDIPELMKSLDVFVLTSRWEGLPRVYLEAAAAAVPVVGTRVDGAAEAVQDGVNGYLVEPGDLDALAARILELLADPPMARAMGRAGRDLAPEYRLDDMVRRQQQEYESLLAARSAEGLSWSVARSTSP
jgi:glycosyltransferase involved in cell wall biosynthesis